MFPSGSQEGNPAGPGTATVPWQRQLRHGTPELPVRSGLGDEAELAERGDAVVEADLLDDEEELRLFGGRTR